MTKKKGMLVRSVIVLYDELICVAVKRRHRSRTDSSSAGRKLSRQMSRQMSRQKSVEEAKADLVKEAEASKLIQEEKAESGNVCTI